MNVELVTRRGCHLCDEALAALRGLGVEPLLRDVDADDELFRLYDFRVPVLLSNGRVLCEGHIDRAALSAALGPVLVERCGPEAAPEVLRLTRAAFAVYEGRLDPPSGALSETLERVRDDLARHGGALARLGAEPVGCLRYDVPPGHLHVRRLAVEPARQGQGIGRALMEWAEGFALENGLREVRLGVRVQLPGNRAFYERLGYRVVAEHAHPGYKRPTWLEMARALGEG